MVTTASLRPRPILRGTATGALLMISSWPPFFLHYFSYPALGWYSCEEGFPFRPLLAPISLLPFRSGLPTRSSPHKEARPFSLSIGSPE